MKVSFEHEPDLDAWSLRTEGTLATLEDVEVWRTELLRKLTQVGERVYLLIDMSQFEIRPEITAAYGQVAKKVAQEHTLGIVRYGAGKGTTVTSVRHQAVVNRFPSNIFPNRAQAIEALLQIKKLPA